MDFILLPKLENLIFCPSRVENSVHLPLASSLTHTAAHSKHTKSVFMKYLGHLYQNRLRSNQSVGSNFFPAVKIHHIVCVIHRLKGYLQAATIGPFF